MRRSAVLGIALAATIVVGACSAATAPSAAPASAAPAIAAPSHAPPSQAAAVAAPSIAPQSKYDDGDIVFGTQDMTNKCRNIKHNPNVTVLVDVEEPELRGVLIYGRAELDYEDVVAKRVTIFEKYMPTEDAQRLATRMAANFVPVVIRVKPARVSSYDYAKDGFIHVGSADAP